MEWLEIFHYSGKPLELNICPMIAVENHATIPPDSYPTIMTNIERNGPENCGSSLSNAVDTDEFQN